MFIAQKGGTGHRPKCFGLCDPNRLCVHLEGRAGGIVRPRYNCQLTFAPLGAEWTVRCDLQQLEATQSPQQPILQPLMSGYERGVDHRSLFALIFTFHFFALLDEESFSCVPSDELSNSSKVPFAR